MIKWILTLFLSFSFSAHAFELMVGDILLQPRKCWSCTLIEQQENSIYSHMAMVIEVTPTLKVIDALGKVQISEYATFNAGTDKTRKISVRRFRNGEAVQFLQKNQKRLMDVFKKDFEGLLYDHDFLWNNFDDQGREKLYCSEFITKFLDVFMDIEIPMKRMKFDINRDAWVMYFRGLPPDGKWGNSPASFETSELYYEVGEL